MKDFFISYTHLDRQWAEWIALTLTKASYTCIIQAWDFQPGMNFVLEMQKATLECNQTIIVLSPDWLASTFTQPEWSAAFALDPTGKNRKIIPVRVKPCEPPGLLRSIIYCDLLGLNEEDARVVLTKAVAKNPARPDSVAFPSSAEEDDKSLAINTQNTKSFPGSSTTIYLKDQPPLEKSALDLLSVMQTTGTTFEAQANLRDKLYKRITLRLVIDPSGRLEYEEFFAKYFSLMDDYEKKTFATIRSFTINILSKYNQKILDILEKGSDLLFKIKGISQLKDHLVIWISKFESVFLNTPEMCLLYVGVEEGKPFPRDVAQNTWEFLKNQGMTETILKIFPKPFEGFEEANNNYNEDWYFELKKRWIKKNIVEIENERKKILVDSTPEGLIFDKKISFKELYIKFGELIRNELCFDLDNIGRVNGFEYGNFENVLMRHIEELIELRDEKWPLEFRKILETIKTCLDQPRYYLLSSLSLMLPTIAYYIDLLGLKNDLSLDWEKIYNYYIDYYTNIEEKQGLYKYLSNEPQ